MSITWRSPVIAAGGTITGGRGAGAGWPLVRVNAISAGPVRTLSASGIAGFRGMYGEFRDVAPLRRNIDIDDVGGAAVYLSSDLAAAVTGEVHYVDAGFNVLGVPTSGD